MEEEPTSGDIMGSPAIGDMDGDGNYEVLYMGRSNNMYCVDAATGAGKWVFESGGNDDGVCLYDVTGDGKKEAIAQGGDYLIVVNSEGKLVWQFQVASKTNYCPNAFDVDRDGAVEVIGADGSYVYCISSTGTEKWRFPIGDKLNHEQPVIGDFNNDGEYPQS